MAMTLEQAKKKIVELVNARKHEEAEKFTVEYGSKLDDEALESWVAFCVEMGVR